MHSISGTNISLTRGDTLRIKIDIVDGETSEAYVPVTGDAIRFAMKKTYQDEMPALVKDIPIDTLVLTIEHNDTADLEFSKYVYDIQITKANGDVDTFIKGTIKLTEEVC